MACDGRQFQSFREHGSSSWGDTPAERVLPVEFPPKEYGAEGRTEIVAPTNPVVSNLARDTLGQRNYFGGNIVVPQIGSEVVANMRRPLRGKLSSGRARRYPLLVSWEIDHGRPFVMAAAFMNWKYYGDFS